MVQEHKLVGETTAAAKNWLKVRGWRVEFTPAVRKANAQREGGMQEVGKKWAPSAGVGFIWRHWVAVTKPIKLWVPGRVAIVEFMSKGLGRLCCMSVCGHDTGHTRKRNKEMTNIVPAPWYNKRSTV